MSWPEKKEKAEREFEKKEGRLSNMDVVLILTVIVVPRFL
jgi:hypothetical protein